MGLDRTEQIEIIEEVLQRMDQCAEDLRALDDRQIEAYCLADFEGVRGGWLGRHVRDILEERLQALRRGEEHDEG
ncbi:MAG: hypothetical protein O2895_00400 [Chloroflexi bacterium]|nr:hypothetical protein [Chloroflexota bacterium]